MVKDMICQIKRKFLAKYNIKNPTFGNIRSALPNIENSKFGNLRFKIWKFKNSSTKY